MASSSSTRSGVCMIDGPVGRLEVTLGPGSDSGPLAGRGYYAVVCHPHPLYGGTMDDAVVITVAGIYQQLGIPVARFNFRSVGGSEGNHDNAEGEVDDLTAVADHLQQQTSGVHRLLAGYSFGSIVAARGSLVTETEHLVLLAPPVEHYVYAPAGCFNCPALVVLGEQDEFVDGARARAWAEQLSSSVEVLSIAGASHFFHGQMNEIRQCLGPALQQALL